MTTLEKVVAYWRTIHAVKHDVNRGIWKGNDPRDKNSDSGAFGLWDGKLLDGEGGGYNDLAGDSGTLYSLASQLNIVTPDNTKENGDQPTVDLASVPKDKPHSKPIPARRQPKAHNTPDTPKEAKTSKRAYKDMADYCAAKGVPIEHAKSFGWSEQPGKILMKHTDNGIERRTRVRLLKEGGGFYPPQNFEDYCKVNNIEWTKQYQGQNYRCFYGFDKALELARKYDQPLVLCNGQPSVMVAHYQYLSALAQTDGEGEDGLQENLLRRLVDAIKQYKLKIIIALDADTAGRAMAEVVHAQLQVHGIDAPCVDFGGYAGYDLADYCKQHGSKSLEYLIKLAELREGQDKPVSYGKDMRSKMLEMINGKRMAGQVILMPLKIIRRVGGFAAKLMPRKMTYIYGDTGSGKTIMLESIVEKAMDDGVIVLWWSPEWSDDEFLWRQLQRRGVATYNELVDYFTGAEQIAPGLKAKIKRALDEMDNRAGDIIIFQTDKFTEDILARMKNQANLLRRDNPDVKILPVFDYAQRMKVATKEENRTSYETATDLVKSFCEQFAVHSIVTVQVKKKDFSDTLIGKSDAQWIRGDFANLILTINPIMIDGEKQIVRLKGGNDRPHYKAVINVAKNSMGTGTRIDALVDGSRLKMIDAN